MARQEESLPGEGRGSGDSRGDGLPAKGDGGQAAASLTLVPDGTGSGSFLDSFLYTRLRKQPSDVWQ